MFVNINRLGHYLAEAEVQSILAIIKKGHTGTKTDRNHVIANQLISWLKMPRADISREILHRYARMSTRELYIPFTLARPEIVEQRIIAPLESAKRFACRGEYLGSVALSGLVGEMLVVFVWEMNSSKRRDSHDEEIDDKRIINNKFDKIPQSVRVNMLEAFDYIDTETVTKFRDLSEKRNAMLHSWTDSIVLKDIEESAIRCYSLAASLMKGIFKLELQDPGSLKMDKKVIKFLKSRNIV